jgi:TRAP-type mannitol/chloroaromatic compound transport system permease small subunit
VMVFGALTILSGAYTLKEKAHVNMDLFHMRLSDRGKAIVDVITFPFFLLFACVLLWLGWDFAVRSVMLFEKSISNWHPPIWPVKLMIPLGALLLLLQGLAKFMTDLSTIIDTNRERNVE